MGKMVRFLQWLVQIFAQWGLSVRSAGIVPGGKALAPCKGLPNTPLAQSSLTAITHRRI